MRWCGKGVTVKGVICICVEENRAKEHTNWIARLGTAAVSSSGSGEPLPGRTRGS